MRSRYAVTVQTGPLHLGRLLLALLAVAALLLTPAWPAAAQMTDDDDPVAMEEGDDVGFEEPDFEEPVMEEPPAVEEPPAPPPAGGATPAAMIGNWNYTSAQYMDPVRGLRTVGIGGDLRLEADGRFAQTINFPGAGSRVARGTYQVQGDQLLLQNEIGDSERLTLVLGSRPGTSGGVVDTLTLTPSPATPDSYTYTLTKPR